MILSALTNLFGLFNKAAHALSAALAATLIFVIRAYQSVHTAFFRGSCRFHPTCSHYALEAIEVHGPGRGTLLTAWRILRCQPFCRGGFDPVPEPKSKHQRQIGSQTGHRSETSGNNFPHLNRTENLSTLITGI